MYERHAQIALPERAGERDVRTDLESALAMLDHIANTIPLRPTERALTRNEAVALRAHINLLKGEIEHWESKCTGRHGSQAPCFSGSQRGEVSSEG